MNETKLNPPRRHIMRPYLKVGVRLSLAAKVMLLGGYRVSSRRCVMLCRSGENGNKKASL
jgi:hypothetical protein